MVFRSVSCGVSLAATVCVAAAPHPAYAWGERGHDITTRVAVRLVVERRGAGGPLSGPLAAHAHALGRLSNVPDALWRRAAFVGVAARNAPTHFINLERFADEPLLGVVPHSFPVAARSARARGHDLATFVGTAPWRVEQLTHLLLLALHKARTQRQIGAFGDDTFRDVVVHTGLLSHFIADLAQPQHTTIDYDGWHAKQGGLHKYWEHEALNEMPANLAEHVLECARGLRAPAGAGKRPWAFEHAIALSHDSRRLLGRLHAIDAQAAVLEPSRQHPNRVPARRRPAREAAAAFEKLAIERLAVGARVLADYWIRAWRDAGAPDLRGARLAAYNPAFIEPWWLEVSQPPRPGIAGSSVEP